MYLIAITVGLCVAYFILLFLFWFFFENKKAEIPKNSFRSIILIILLSLAGYVVVLNIPDLELGNRFLHAFGGGFLAFMVCFLVVKDSTLPITKFQFFVFSALIVTALGVSNELLEFFLQHYFGLISSASTTDTWLDLLSNTVGSIIASTCFVPFISRKDSIE